MTATPWFKFYPSDWIAGVSRLSAAERGVYVTLLALMYDHGEPIVRDDVRLARMCGLPTPGLTRALNSLLALGKVTLEGNRLFNERAKVECHEREVLIGHKREGARVTNEKRAKKSSDGFRISARTTARTKGATRAPASEPEPEGSSLRSEPKNTPLRGASSGQARPDPQLPLLTVVSSKALVRRPESDEVILDRALDQWNPWAASHGSPQVRALTGQRAIHCRQRMKDLAEMEGIDPDEAFRRLLAKCAESFFVKGQPRKKLSFDQLMREGFMVRMMEGEYLYEPKKGNGRW